MGQPPTYRAHLVALDIAFGITTIMSLRALIATYAERLAPLAPWTLPLKLILGGLLGALGGAGFLGFLSEYATYSYSIYYGFRPPLEGIPYLKATVTIGSFVLLLTGAAVFLLSHLFVRLIVWSLEWPFSWIHKVLRRIPSAGSFPDLSDFRTVIDRLSKRPKWQVLLAALVVAFCCGAILSMDVAVFNYLLQDGDIDLFSVGISAGIIGAIYGFVLTVAMAWRGAIWWLGGVATLGYFLVWISMLFSPAWYASFLRTVGYGGGLPVTIEFREHAQLGQAQTINCFLLLRTSDVLLVMSKDNSTILEVPRDQIRAVQHASGGLRQLAYKLPNKLTAK